MFMISRFAELVKLLPHRSLDKLIDEYGADKHSKGFGCRRQLLAMLYGQLSGATSLRQLEVGFNAQRTHHYHLRCGEIRRSTLADANAARDPQVFSRVAQELMNHVQRKTRSELTQLLYLLDSTSLTLKGRGFDQWTAQRRTRNTQGMKLHLLYAPGSEVPVFHSMTMANVNDIDEAVKLPIEPNSTSSGLSA